MHTYLHTYPYPAHTRSRALGSLKGVPHSSTRTPQRPSRHPRAPPGHAAQQHKGQAFRVRQDPSTLGTRSQPLPSCHLRLTRGRAGRWPDRRPPAKPRRRLAGGRICAACKPARTIQQLPCCKLACGVRPRRTCVLGSNVSVRMRALPGSRDAQADSLHTLHVPSSAAHKTPT